MVFTWMNYILWLSSKISQLLRYRRRNLTFRTMMCNASKNFAQQMLPVTVLQCSGEGKKRMPTQYDCHYMEFSGRLDIWSQIGLRSYDTVVCKRIKIGGLGFQIFRLSLTSFLIFILFPIPSNCSWGWIFDAPVAQFIFYLSSPKKQQTAMFCWHCFKLYSNANLGW